MYQMVLKRVLIILTLFLQIDSFCQSILIHNKTFTNIGKTENQLKTGPWTEFELDSSFLKLKSMYTPASGDSGFYLGILPIKLEGEYVKGKRTGLWKKFYSLDKKDPFTWNLMTELPYREGLLEGIKKDYSFSQKLLKTESFRNNLSHGEAILYYDSGEIFSKIDYKNGLENGWSKEYSLNGKLKREIYYINGLANGKMNLYNDLEMLIEQGNLINGKYAGEYIWYYETTGSKKKVGNFDGESKVGLWQIFRESGELEAEYTYINNKVEGIWKYYHKNGNLWSEILYKNGKYDEVLSNYDINGKEREKGTLKGGNGTIITYTEEGEKSKILTITNGEEVNNK